MPKQSSEEDIICITCQQEEKDSRKVIECAYCHKCEHFKCKNVIGNAVRKLRDQLYFCSAECNTIYLQSTRNSEVESQVLKELHNVLSEVRGTRAELQAVKSTVGDIEKFQNFLSDQLDSLLGEVKSLKKEQAELKEDVNMLRGKQQKTSEAVDLLELEVDRLNRASISKNAIILGVPMKSNETVQQIVQNIAVAVGCHLPDGAIVEAKRLINKDRSNDGKQPPIKVSFSDERLKEELFSKKKSFGNLLPTAIDSSFKMTASKIILRDELTAHGLKLYKEERDVQDYLDIKFVWPGRNGAILTRKEEGSKIEVVRSHKDMEKLRKINKKRKLNESGSSHSGSSSPNSEPSSKR